MEPGIKHVLECDATGLPVPTITWLRDGKPIGDEKNKVTFNKNHTRYVYIVTDIDGVNAI